MEALEKKETPTYLLKIINSYLRDKTLLYETEKGTLSCGTSCRMYLLRLQIPDGRLSNGFCDNVARVVTARTTLLLEIVANETMRSITVGWKKWFESCRTQDRSGAY